MFFSAITLGRVTEQEFEPYIFKALSTARAMLLLCFDNEKIESPWGGKGVDKNYSEAIKLYKKSAGQGFGEDVRRLAVCYESGDGVEKIMKKRLHYLKNMLKTAVRSHRNRQLLL